jgi:hypothetical protein
MLATLLPGLRELRAPLAAGYLWLVSAWFILAPKISSSIWNTKGVWQDAYRLGEFFGRPGILVAATFTAYVIGILTERLARLLVWPVGLVRDAVLPGGRTYGILQDAVLDTLVRRYHESQEFRTAVRQHLDVATLAGIFVNLPRFWSGDLATAKALEEAMKREASLDDPVVSETTEEVLANAARRDNELRTVLYFTINLRYYADSLNENLYLIPARLVGKEQEIYERWDRLRAESEFRLSIAPPLAAMAIILANRLNPLWLLLIVPSAYLTFQGFAREEAATAQLAESIRAGRVASAVLEDIRTAELHWSETNGDRAQLQPELEHVREELKLLPGPKSKERKRRRKSFTREHERLKRGRAKQK